MSMCKCKKCGNKFEVPKNAIQMVYAIYCKPCINIGLKKMAKMPLKKYMEIQAKQIGILKP